MGLAQEFLQGFEPEAATTRRLLERVPEPLDWRPHAKSMSLRDLATHLSNLPSWTVLTVARDAFDLAPVGAPPPRAVPVQSVAEALANFDANIEKARKAVTAASDERLTAPWALLVGGVEKFRMPRIAVLRSMVLHHMIHHRAQLGIYLRLNDVPLPSVYGPTADERI